MKRITEFRKGEHVLIDGSYVYPGYKAIAIELNADIGGKWKSNRSVPKWKENKSQPAIFLNSVAKQYKYNCYALIELTDTEEQYVIQLEGIKKDLAANLLPDTLFEI